MKIGFVVLIHVLGCGGVCVFFWFFVFHSFGEFWYWDHLLGIGIDPKFIGPPLPFVIEECACEKQQKTGSRPLPPLHFS